MVEFFESPKGVDFLHRLVVGAHLVFGEVRPCGTRLVSEFIRLLDLEPFVGTSHGCQYDVRVRIEEGPLFFPEVDQPLLWSRADQIMTKATTPLFVKLPERRERRP